MEAMLPVPAGLLPAPASCSLLLTASPSCIAPLLLQLSRALALAEAELRQIQQREAENGEIRAELRAEVDRLRSELADRDQQISQRAIPRIVAIEHVEEEARDEEAELEIPSASPSLLLPGCSSDHRPRTQTASPSMQPGTSRRERSRSGRSHKRSRPNKKFKCEECGQTFARRQHLEDHQNTHQEEMGYACPIYGCHFSCDYKSSYHRHLRTQHAISPTRH
ncbi:zinc finger protein 394-like [Hyalella azteca]|uniref:Zinc finger protein 394-like n=1 Tax=Hyalella azteca TaxID=294128 RepID=A0A979FFB3_HYAAZ|nr:zinc finger protein 394-like [Hyalella azteca]